MAENILKGTIKIDAPGIDQTANSVNSALDKITHSMKTTSAASYLARDAINDMSHEFRDLPYALNNPAMLAGPFGRLQALFFDLKQQTGSAQGALSALASSLMGGGGLLLAGNLLVSTFAILGPKLFGFGQGASEAAKKTEELNKSLHEAFQSVADEAAKVEVLYASLNRENLSRREKIGIIKELQRIAPEYFATLNAEKVSIGDLKIAYDNYIASLRNAAEAKVLDKQLQDVIDKRLELERVLKPQQFTYDEKGNRIQNIRLMDIEGKMQEALNKDQRDYNNLLEAEKQISSRIAQLTPPHLSEADLKVPKIKIDKEEFQKRIHEAIYDPDFGDLPGRFIKELIQSFYERSGGYYLDYKPNPEYVKYLQKTISSIVGDTSFNPFKGGQQQLVIPLTAKLSFVKSKDSGLDVDELKAISKTIDGTLTPAFENLFSAIEQGKPAMQAFFQSIEQSLLQLIGKLIAAAATAAILKMIFSATSLAGAGFGSGSFADVFKSIAHFSSGGEVPGTGNSDTVPALLTPGEYVIPKQYAQQVKALLKGNIPSLSSISSIATPMFTPSMHSGMGGIHVTVGGILRADGYGMKAVLSKVEQRQGRAFS